MSAPDNPPAFPVQLADQVSYENQPGMTLRDYFAGQALAGLTARSVEVYRKLAASDATIPMVEEHLTDTLATVAYRYADAMLKERSRQ